MRACLKLFFLLAGAFTCSAAPVVEADVCVYGGTSGGVAAAVSAARLGKSVVLISLNSHVGGMTASGLGVTDIGPGNNTAYVGGISREFYRRVGQKYGSTNLVIWFEPRVAERVFWEMLAEAGIPVYTNELLATVSLSGTALTELTMESGTRYRAKQFIDTTYEGDLMAAAGVTFTVGREGTAQYGESLAGIRSPGSSYTYDPYVVPGNPGSGLLPLVNPGTGGIVGQGDHRLQAFNYRLCLTQNATNKIAITPPANYSEDQYELVRRYLNARVAQDGSVSLGQLIHIQTIIPNGKTDINANGELSTDMVGYNYTWATNTYAGREGIRQQHEDYIRGLLHFYATSTNVPLNVRTNMQTWGLAKDEFTDHGGWPWQIYVREGRRMVSDYVMIQQDAMSQRSAPDPICLAAYAVDSHGVQRLASGGFARWEGSIGSTPPYPYGISYRSIIPRAGECRNLFSTFALSASHVGFASCRMEPVFMMTSQAAATAAAIAIDDNVAVQQVNYPKLSAQLRADSQLLVWSSPSMSTNGIILDQGGPGTATSGGWTAGANAGGWQGNYWHDGNSAKGSRWIRYTPELPTNGVYEVFAWWVPDPNRTTNAPYDITHAAGTSRILVNQRNSSGGWFKLLTTNFNTGTSSSVTIRNDGTTGYVIADGIRFQPVGDIIPVVPPVLELVASDALAGEFQTNRGRFSFVRSGDTMPNLVVTFTISGTATNGLDYQTIATNINIPSGVSTVSLPITPIPNSTAEGSRTVILQLSASTNYHLTSVSNATVTIEDRPIDAWRFGAFSTSELLDPDLSGDTADPDGDRFCNVLEYALGLPPKQSGGTNQPFARIENGQFLLTYTRSTTARDVALTFEQSLDLGTWQPAVTEEVENLYEGAFQRLTIKLVPSVDQTPARYLRFVVRRL